MTSIYIKHANGEIMEVQNWETLTDYGAMITRQLNADERRRYLALKAIRMRDSEIWRLFHPVPKTNPSEDSRPDPCFPKAPVAKTSFRKHPVEVRLKNIPRSETRDDGATIDISIRHLSRSALLHIIQRACSRDIKALKTASRDELLSLASVVLPQSGVRVRVLP